jgi:hypothetical protein
MRTIVAEELRTTQKFLVRIVQETNLGLLKYDEFKHLTESLAFCSSLYLEINVFF